MCIHIRGINQDANDWNQLTKELGLWYSFGRDLETEHEASIMGEGWVACVQNRRSVNL